ncbi:MAG: glucosaminidase domain-containing protein, partial [Bacteroidales bacterium]|nr:glucosaminidase domain-containing protein [Bacteroidales bacterium]
MKRLLIILSLVLAGLAVTGQDSRQTYIDKYSDIAVSEMYRTGVPASITLAQGIIESGAGLSKLAVEGNNHFGIKCHTDWKGRTMAVDDDKKGECFRVYKNAEQSFRDHSDFLRYRDRYKFLFSYDVTDYKSWAYGLKKAGYATDPAYSGKLIKMIEDYKLWRYDTPKVEERPDTIPESPEVIEEPKRIDTDVYDEDFVFPLKRPVYEKNGVPFVYASEGDSYASIAQSYKLFRKEILRYNDLD